MFDEAIVRCSDLVSARFEQTGRCASGEKGWFVAENLVMTGVR